MANGTMYHQLSLTTSPTGATMVTAITVEETASTAPLPPEDVRTAENCGSAPASTYIVTTVSTPSPADDWEEEGCGCAAPSSTSTITTVSTNRSNSSRSISPKPSSSSSQGTMKKKSKSPKSKKKKKTFIKEDPEFIHPEMLYGTNNNCRNFSTDDIRDVSTSSWIGLDLEDTKTVETFMSPITMTPTISSTNKKKMDGSATTSLAANIRPLPLIIDDTMTKEDKVSLDEIIQERRQRRRRFCHNNRDESSTDQIPRNVKSLTQLIPSMTKRGNKSAVEGTKPQSNASWPQHDAVQRGALRRNCLQDHGGDNQKPRKVRSLTQLMSSFNKGGGSSSSSSYSNDDSNNNQNATWGQVAKPSRTTKSRLPTRSLVANYLVSPRSNMLLQGIRRHQQAQQQHNQQMNYSHMKFPSL